MNLARNLIQGTVGGIIGGAKLGLLEAIVLLATNGAPDLLSPFYGVLLYGLIGLPFGFAAGVALTLYEKVREPFRKDGDAVAFLLGGIFAFTPMALFVLRYQINKTVFQEKGVPLQWMAAILVGMFLADYLTMKLGRTLLKGAFAFMLQGRGFVLVWGGLLLVTGITSLFGKPVDPRSQFAAGKVVPEGMTGRPNVLVIMVDTLRADYLGTYGKEGASPAIDSFADDAIVFEHAYAPASWTRASGASLMTGVLPSTHNAFTKAARLPDDAVLWSEVLHDAGVTTGALINNINMTASFNFDQGYDTFMYEAPEYAFGATESVFALTFYKVVHKLNERLGGSKHVNSFYQPASTVLADTKAFMDANKGGRWALFTHLMEPHDPYFEHPSLAGSGPEYNGVGYARAEHEHPDPELADYLKGVYADEIRFMDDELGRFFQWMKDQGTYDDTLIILTADHGEEFNEHGGFWHGTTLYEEQIHVPLIVKLPKNELAGTRAPWTVRTLDVPATITTALGLKAPEAWYSTDVIADVMLHDAQAKEAAADRAKYEEALAALDAGEDPVELAEGLEGISFPGNLEAEDLANALRAELEDALVEPEADPCAAYTHELDRVIVAEEDFEGNVLEAIRMEGFKWMTANAGNPRGLDTQMLFDLIADPGETTNRVGDKGVICNEGYEDKPRRLGKKLGQIIDDAKAGSLKAESACMSEDEFQRLKNLGYIAKDAPYVPCD